MYSAPTLKGQCWGKYNENILQRFEIKVSGIQQTPEQETYKYKYNDNGNTTKKNVSGTQISFMYSAPT